MPNHVHLIVVLSDEDGLRRTFADAHRRYTGFINGGRSAAQRADERGGVGGHLSGGRARLV